MKNNKVRGAKLFRILDNGKKEEVEISFDSDDPDLQEEFSQEYDDEEGDEDDSEDSSKKGGAVSKEGTNRS